MLRTNLSTRPFYNQRGVRFILLAAAILAVLFTAVNVTRVVMLAREQAALRSEVTAAESRAEELRAQALRARQTVSAEQAAALSDAAREANQIIGRRLFSWTDLLNRLGATLPDDVRITSLRPSIDPQGTITVSMTVTGRSVEDLATFMANLETTGGFTDVIPRQDDTTDDGLFRATVEGVYAPAR